VGEGFSRTAHVPRLGGVGQRQRVPMNHLNKDGKPCRKAEEGRPLIKENTHQSARTHTERGSRIPGVGGWCVKQQGKGRGCSSPPCSTFDSRAAQGRLLRLEAESASRGGRRHVGRVPKPGWKVGWDLRSRVTAAPYRAQPSRRVYIPKPRATTAIGIAALEDRSSSMPWSRSSIRFTKRTLGFSYGSGQDAAAPSAGALYVAITRKR